MKVKATAAAKAKQGWWMVAALALLAAAGCSSSDGPTEPVQGPAIFRVQVGVEEFAIRLDDPARIATAQRFLESGRIGVVAGELAAGNGGFNAPYGWHLLPGTVEFPDVAIELCDGLPSHVQNDLPYWLGTVKRYCPWSARIVARLTVSS